MTAAIPLDLSDIKLCAYDMDNTLYPYTEGFLARRRAVQAQVVAELSEGTLSVEEAEELCQRSQREHGNRWTLAVRTLGLKPIDTHAPYHRAMCVAHVEPVSGLRFSFQVLAAQGVAVSIVTEAHTDYAERVVEKLRIDDLVAPDNIITLDQPGAVEKSRDAAMFVAAARKAGVETGEMIAVEDKLINLFHVKAAGGRTAYMHWGRPLDELPDYVDIQVETPVALNAALHAARAAADVTALAHSLRGSASLAPL